MAHHALEEPQPFIVREQDEPKPEPPPEPEPPKPEPEPEGPAIHMAPFIERRG